MLAVTMTASETWVQMMWKSLLSATTRVLEER
jgi:hypothetical protein